MSKIIVILYVVMDKRFLWVFFFVMVFLLVGCMFWDLFCFVVKISELEIWYGLLLMWVVCVGVIYGVGFCL